MAKLLMAYPVQVQFVQVANMLVVHPVKLALRFVLLVLMEQLVILARQGLIKSDLHVFVQLASMLEVQLVKIVFRVVILAKIVLLVMRVVMDLRSKILSVFLMIHPYLKNLRLKYQAHPKVTLNYFPNLIA